MIPPSTGNKIQVNMILALVELVFVSYFSTCIIRSHSFMYFMNVCFHDQYKRIHLKIVRTHSCNTMKICSPAVSRVIRWSTQTSGHSIWVDNPNSPYTQGYLSKGWARIPKQTRWNIAITDEKRQIHVRKYPTTSASLFTLGTEPHCLNHRFQYLFPLMI